MKKCALAMLGFLAVSGACHADGSNQFVKANIEFKNTHGVVASGTWLSMTLQDNLIPSTGNQHFTAVLVDPIFNQTLNEELIPAKALVSGTYHNDGNVCSFEIESISFKGTEIGLAPGAYSIVSATLANQPECNPSFSYGIGQHMEFQTKVDIAGLDSLVEYKDYTVKDSKDRFVQSYGNASYAITGITKFTNGFMQINVRFFDTSIRSKLVPVYFDEAGLPHSLNFALVATDGMQTGINDTNSYLILSHYNNFGFGIIE